MRGLLAAVLVGVAATSAYAMGRRHHAPAPPAPPLGALPDLERRVARLERAPAEPPEPRVLRPVAPRGQVGKPFAVSHYEALARQVARERQIADLDARLAGIGRDGQVRPGLRVAHRANGINGRRRSG